MSIVTQHIIVLYKFQLEWLYIIYGLRQLLLREDVVMWILMIGKKLGSLHLSFQLKNWCKVLIL